MSFDAAAFIAALPVWPGTSLGKKTPCKVVGPRGSGKTTLAAYLTAQLRALGVQLQYAPAAGISPSNTVGATPSLATVLESQASAPSPRATAVYVSEATTGTRTAEDNAAIETAMTEGADLYDLSVVATAQAPDNHPRKADNGAANLIVFLMGTNDFYFAEVAFKRYTSGLTSTAQVQAVLSALPPFTALVIDRAAANSGAPGVYKFTAPSA